ncbi:MAG: ferredoxin family protein [Prevotellaceae bacterium]|jgi:NAD-dependent dihydropyrimidine dehydrogenase PreA subunit|nr:ferredoxin family protein [Prevotellaceae bacterium]
MQTTQNTPVTLCACASRTFIPKEKVAELAAALKNAGCNVAIEADLCKKAVESPAAMAAIAGGTVLACHPRAVASLFAWLGLEAKRIENMREQSRDELLSQFGLSFSAEKDAAEKAAFLKKIEEFPVESGTDAWFPVLDKARCVDCGKCHDFCLFGVYTIENKQVKVAQPHKCKNNCPACARMCPSRAIIFSKYEKSPINGGTAEEETFTPEEMDKMYRARLQMRLQQRRASVSLLKKDGE